MARKVYVGAENFEKATLPSGYTQVEYIQSSGTQYIDTEFKPNQDTRIVIDYQITSSHNGEGQLCSARNSENGPFWILYCNTNNSTWHTARYASQDGVGFGTNDRNRHVVDFNKNAVSFDGKTTVTFTYSAFTISCTMPIFCRNTAGTLDAYTSMKLYSFKVYDNGILVRHFIPCINASGVVGLYDTTNSKFYTNAGSGSFTAGEAYKASVAREAKQIYIGVENISRRVRKGYIGIGGVTRPFWGEDKLAYYGKITDMQSARYRLAATSVGDYALFGGGYTTYATSHVDAYSKTLTRTTVSALAGTAQRLNATRVGDYALFGGGSRASVTAYNLSLTKSTPTALDNSAEYIAATTVGNYALFGGGGSNTGDTTTVVYAYNSALTKSKPTALSKDRTFLAATAVGDYALFCGGQGYSGLSNVVDAYNKSLTRSNPTTLGVARRYLTAVTVGNYALVAGGYSADGYSVNVDVYNTSLTKTTAANLGNARGDLRGTTLGKWALIGGGSGSSIYSTVDVYDDNLTKITMSGMSVSRTEFAATTVGNYALFGGGVNNGTKYASVDAYTIL